LILKRSLNILYEEYQMERVCFGTHTYDTTCGSCNRAVALEDFVTPDQPAVVEQEAQLEAVVQVAVRVRRRVRRTVDEIVERAQELQAHRDTLEQAELAGAEVAGAGAEALEENNIWRCNLCPNNAEHNLPPEPEDMANAPRCTLMCGHQVHTHCVFNIIYGDNFVTRCGECQVSFLRPEAYNHYHQNNPRNPNNNNIKKLWEENADFRKEIFKFKRMAADVNRLEKSYVSLVKNLKTEFKEIIKTNVEMIKMQKRSFSKRLTSLPGRRIFLSKASRLKNLKNSICRRYNVDSYDTFNTLKNDTTLTPPPPKLGKYIHSRSWRHSSHYTFRIRL